MQDGPAGSMNTTACRCNIFAKCPVNHGAFFSWHHQCAFRIAAVRRLRDKKSGYKSKKYEYRLLLIREFGIELHITWNKIVARALLIRNRRDSL